mgnify:CR=1 FL=1
MANQAIRVANLAIASSLARTDRLVVLTNPSTTANVKTVNVDTFVANLSLSNSVPANSTSNGYTGTIRWDSDYVYICVANNTWKRASLSTW